MQQNHSQIITAALSKLSLATQLSQVTAIVAETARTLTGSDGATFVLRDQDKCYYADEDAISPLWKGKRFPLEACISGWSMLNREVVLIRDIYQDSRIPHVAYRPTFVKSLCMVPIRQEDPIGAIGNYWAKEYSPSPEDIKLLQVLANSTAVALENIELKQSLLRKGTESADLRDRAQELEVALHSMAHDLRNPVGAMAGLAELLQVHLAKTQDDLTRNYLQAILETGHQTAAQIERMLSLYRVTSGKISKERVDISALAQRVLESLRAQYPNREIQAEIQPSLSAYADPSLVHLVMENLLSNAVKYSAKKPKARIEIGQMNEADDLRTFFVRDYGEGFEPTAAHKLFRPLSRLHSEAEFPGTGLGLASVARIIEVHGGTVRAEAKKSEGATFYFSLPISA